MSLRYSLSCVALFVLTTVGFAQDFGPKPTRFYSINITQFASKQTLWVALPNFQAGAKSSDSPDFGVEELTQALENAVPDLQNNRAVIFDLRGNDGLDESFGRRLSAAFWGTPDTPKAFAPAVAVVTDGHCGRACAAFAELVRTQPHALHIGEGYSTSAGRKRNPHVRFPGPWTDDEVQRFAAAKVGAIPDGESAWRQTYLSDLKFYYETILNNHPASNDELNPGARSWVKEGYAKAKARASQVRDFGGYIYGLRGYINGFKDPHTQFRFDFPSAGADWPGFVVAMRGGKPTIVGRDADAPELPQIGAEVLACDGQTLDGLVARSIYPFLFNEELRADRLRAVTRLFLKVRNPFAPSLQSCRFLESGTQTERGLAWRAQNASFATAFGTANFGVPTRWGIHSPRPDVVWIGLETFSTAEEPAKQLEAVIGEIEKNAAKWKTKKKAIIFDVRGNGGGSSAWGDRIHDAIWGKSLEQEDRTAVDWRASKANLDFLEEAWIRLQKNTTITADLRKSIEETLAALRDAVRQGRIYARVGARDPGPEGGLTKRRPRGPSPFPAQIVFFNDGACGSACADFADRVLHEPGVVHAGYWTSGDGVYMEGRDVSSPSGLSNLFFAMKVYRGRARGHLEEYEPDWLYEGEWDDLSVQRWLFEKLGLP